MFLAGLGRCGPGAAFIGGGSIKAAPPRPPPRLGGEAPPPGSGGSALPWAALFAGAVGAARAAARAPRCAGGRGDSAGRRPREREDPASAPPGTYGQRPPWEREERVPTPRDRSRAARLRRAQEAYKPGEGYGTNVLPFSGVAPYKGATNEMQRRYLALRARKIGRKVEAYREGLANTPREETAVQRIPVPERGEVLGRLRAMLPSIEAEGCSAFLTDNSDSKWQYLFLEGRPSTVRSASLRVMASLVPQRAGAEV